MTFNLTEQRWIPVVTQDWQCQEVSLIEVFKRWEQLREIQAENPPTTLALYRFLLAILHRAYQGPRNVDHWEKISEDNGQQVIAYLKEKAECFDLLHPTQPFMQDIALPEQSSISIYNLSLMQADNTSTVFCHEHQWTGYSISLPQASRLLIRLQSVDPTSLRAFYPPQSKGNRSAANTPTINAANIIVSGSPLKEMLLFNLMQYNPTAEVPSVVSGEDLPTWETGYTGQPKKAIPNGYINYLTYPWRRLRLFAQGEQVSQIAITMGQSLPDGVSTSQWECGIAFREDKPVRLSMERQLWRDAHSFLQSADKSNRPRIIDWWEKLRYEELVENTIHLQIFGLCADKAKPLGWSMEQFSAPVQYLTERDLWNVLSIGIKIAEDHQQAFRSFRGSPYYALAQGLNPPTTGSDAISKHALSLAAALDGASRYWAKLDREFYRFLDELPQDATTGADGITRYGLNKLPDWTNTVQSVAQEAFKESIASIRNYQARALALRSLGSLLRKLRGEKSGKAA
jgi:CRISPR system Cascade subunit CasA